MKFWADIIRAVQTQLGLAALMVLVVSAVGLAFFRKGPVWAQLLVFLSMLIGAGLFIGAMQGLTPVPDAVSTADCVKNLLLEQCTHAAEVVWVTHDMRLENLGTRLEDVDGIPGRVRDGLTLVLPSVPGLCVFADSAVDFVRESCHLPELPAIERLGITKTISGIVTVTDTEARLDILLMMSNGRLSDRHVKGASVRLSDQRRLGLPELDELVNHAEVNLLRALDIPLTEAQRRDIVDAKHQELNPETFQDAVVGWLGDGTTTPPPVPRRPSDNTWLSPLLPAPVWAQPTDLDTPSVQTLFEAYRAALERKQLGRLKSLQPTMTSAQEEALARYFGAADDLKVQFTNVQVVSSEDRALVTFTRRDDFTDSQSGRPSHLEIRISSECVKEEGQWRIVAFKRPS